MIPDHFYSVDDINAAAFYEAHKAASSIDPETLRRAIDAYMAAMHMHVTTVHASAPLTPEQAIEAFRPKTVEF